uniref:Galectin n=1 Tax=Varanus komodoensis TaxID=61221 RepID=A0A8D2LEZ5_VARKO
LQKMPYYRAIPFGLDPESWMLLEGVIPLQSKGFQVDFAYGQFRGASIPLRFKLSFEGPPSSSAVAVFNSFTDREWGKEKKTATHIRQGQRFKMQFIVTSKGFKVISQLVLGSGTRVLSQELGCSEGDDAVALTHLMGPCMKWSVAVEA